MRKTARTIGATVAGVLLAGPAAGAGLPGFVLKAQTEHFSFYSRSARAKIDAEKSERYLARVQAQLGHRVSGRAEYYRYDTPQEIAAGTGTWAEGVTFARAGQIHSTQEFHAHEIVHLVAGQMGNPGAFFHEGLAVALGNEGRWRGKDVDDVARATARKMPIATLVASFAQLEADVAYPVAGSFVAALIRVHGLEKVAAFFRACDGRNTGDAFARTFGQSLQAAGAAWAAAL